MNNVLRTDTDVSRRSQDRIVSAGEIGFSWRSARAFAPDRLRCFLLHLQQLTQPIRISGLPRNLYSIAESLSRGGTLACSFITPTGPAHGCSVRVEPFKSEWLCSLHLGAVENLYDVSTSPAVLDILRAGARMLGCDSAEFSITANTNTDTDHHPQIPPVSVATWLSATEARRRESPGMSIIAEEWDGARLLLRTALPETPDSRLMLRFLLQSAFVDEALARVLAQALRSADWRLRMCAMIAAARRRLRSLGLVVKQADVPSATTPGVTNALRHELVAVQKACLVLLSGAPVPEMHDEAPDTRAGMRAHLLRAIAGQPLAFRDEFSDLIDSLLGETV